MTSPPVVNSFFGDVDPSSIIEPTNAHIKSVHSGELVHRIAPIMEKANPPPSVEVFILPDCGSPLRLNRSQFEQEISLLRFDAEIRAQELDSRLGLCVGTLPCGESLSTICAGFFDSKITPKGFFQEIDGGARLNLLRSDLGMICGADSIAFDPLSPSAFLDGKIPITIHNSGEICKRLVWYHHPLIGGDVIKGCEGVSKNGGRCLDSAVC
jgi:hypothetical protein